MGRSEKKVKEFAARKLSHAERAMSTTEANNQLSMPKPAPQATASVAEDATPDKASSPALSAFSENLKGGSCQQDKAASTITTTPVQKTASIQKSESASVPGKPDLAIMGFSTKTPKHWWELDDYSIQRGDMDSGTLSYFPPDGGKLVVS